MDSVQTFKKAFKIIIGIFIFLIVILLGANSFYTISEQEQAVISTFGKASTQQEPGLHFKIPFIQKVKAVNTTIQGLSIGYDSETQDAVEDESLMITSDFNFVNVDFFIEYKVTDPIKATYNSEDPIGILKNLAQGCIRSVIGSYSVDDVITTGKNQIQATLKEEITEKLDAYDLGIQLVNITIQDSEPPTKEVMEAFKAVETAKQGKETALNNANKYKNEKEPEAEAKVDKIKKEAEAEKASRISEAKGQASRFNDMYQEYKKNPTITKQRMFYETMEKLLPELEVIIDNSEGSTQKIFPIGSLSNVTVTTDSDNTENSKEGKK